MPLLPGNAFLFLFLLNEFFEGREGSAFASHSRLLFGVTVRLAIEVFFAHLPARDDIQQEIRKTFHALTVNVVGQGAFSTGQGEVRQTLPGFGQEHQGLRFLDLRDVPKLFRVKVTGLGEGLGAFPVDGGDLQGGHVAEHLAEAFQGILNAARDLQHGAVQVSFGLLAAFQCSFNMFAQVVLLGFQALNGVAQRGVPFQQFWQGGGRVRVSLRVSHAPRIVRAGSMTGMTDEPGPTKSSTELLPVDLQRRLLDAIRRGASMEDIADLKDSDVHSPDAAIQALKDGNARFFGGNASRPELGANERRAQIIGQTPFAAILACSDSRVPVELVFDQGLGQLFVVRVAGNVVGEAGLGTLEYAIKHLDVHLVVVMGHEGCGAVAAALRPPEVNAQEPPHLQRIIGKIRPSVENLPPIRDKKARMREAVLNNVRHQVQVLRQQPVIHEAEESGRIRVIGGFYEIGSGAVDFLVDDEDLRP